MGAQAAATAALMVLATAVAAWPAAAQVAAPRQDFLSGPRFGVGYSGVMPDVLAGAGIWYLSGPRRFGVFLEGKTSVPNPERHQNYCPPGLGGPCTLEWVNANRNDWWLRDREHWLIMNAGGLYAVSAEFALMLGAGLARRSLYSEFVHPEDDVGSRITLEGNYLVPVEPLGENVVQARLGGLLRVGNRAAFSFGYETAPANMSLGIYLVLP